MAQIPTPRSLSQIIGDATEVFLSKLGLPKLKIGSPILSVLETSAQNDLRTSEDIFGLLNAIDLHNASGDALDQYGNSKNIPRILQKPSSGLVNISDTSFNKISTNVFQGLPAPIIGSVVINVIDASAFPASGNVYIGRGTNQYEGPLAYTSKTDNTSYWSLNLSLGTQKFHNQNETVILAQGGLRNIDAGTQVQTTLGNVSNPIVFSTIYPVSIPDGEITVLNVQVICAQNGFIGNVQAGTITQFTSIPFTNATVTNLLPYSNGLQTEEDSTYRERITNTEQSRTKGTTLAIETFSIGVSSSDENKTVVSASVVNRANSFSTLYIDDGNGYEEQSSGVPFEVLTDSAVGGEQFFEVAQPRPIAKAYLQTTLDPPFNIVDGSILAVIVGGVVYEHSFLTNDFNAINNATPFEVLASINANPLIGFNARIANSSNAVAIFAKSDTNEEIQVSTPTVGIDANLSLGFSTGEVDTTRLYKNDLILFKDGRSATVFSNLLSAWGVISGSKTLTIAVDSTAVTTYTFVDQDFIDANTGFTTIGTNSLSAWIAVINAKIPGITATISAGKIFITSNLGNSARASVNISGGTLVSPVNMFDIQQSTGISDDYALDRNVGQITLGIPLLIGDSLTLGSKNTRAFLQSPSISTLNFISEADFWFALDTKASVVKTGINSISALDIAPDTTASGIRTWGFRTDVKAHDGASQYFTNLTYGDWAIAWEPTAPTDFKGMWRVVDHTNTSFVIEQKVMNFERGGHAYVKLASGKILITGGFTSWNYLGATNSCELFDPTTNKFSPTGSMSTARAFHTATILASGKVLVVGGIANKLSPVAVLTAELYDPTAQTWSLATSIPVSRWHHNATQMATTTRVLVSGGIATGGGYLGSAYYYDEGGDTWTATGAMVHARAFHSSVLLSNNTILAAVGTTTGAVVLKSTELYDPIGNTWSDAGDVVETKQSAAMVVLNNTKALLAGGDANADGGAISNRSTTDLYTVGVGWGAGPAMTTGRSYFGMALMTNHNVIAAFGYHTNGAVTADLFDAGGVSWGAAANPSGNSFSRLNPVAVEVSVNNILFAAGTNNDTNFEPTASAEIYSSADTWSQPSTLSVSNLITVDSGLEFTRTSGFLQKIAISSGNNYTASSLVDSFNSSILGGTASIYKTNKFRIGTNTFSITNGNIALVASNTDAKKTQLPIQNATQNLLGHIGSVETQNTGTGTPDFNISFIRGSLNTSTPVVQWSALTSTVSPSVAGPILGLKGLYDSLTVNRYGNNAKFHSNITSLTNDGNLATLTLRKGVYNDWIPNDRIMFASPYSMSFDDTLAVIVDNDELNKRFIIGMGRQLKPVGSTYGSENEYTDASISGTLAKGFGINFNFNDYALMMKSRVISHLGDGTKAILWRYFRHGASGNLARMRYTLPIGPSLSTLVNVIDNVDQYININVGLRSGALKTGYSIRAATKIGVACTAQSNGISTLKYILGYSVASATRDGANNTTLTLTLPAGITNHGLIATNAIYLKSTSVDFATGTYTIASVTPTTITYTDPGVAAGPDLNIGTVSFDTSEATLSGASPAIAPGDFFNVGSTGGLDPNFEGFTIRLSSVANQLLVGVYDNFGAGVTTTPAWYTLSDLTAFKIFINQNDTSSQIVSNVNAILASPTNVCPISPTLVSDGTGHIDRSTSEENSQSNFYYNLVDGINYIKTTVDPGDPTLNYSFIFKNAPNANLATGSDWANEDIRLVPINISSLIDWMNAPAVSGLFTACSVQLSSEYNKIQLSTLTIGSIGSVQVDGGSANALTIPIVGSSQLVNSLYVLSTVKSGNITGLDANQWVAINNTNPLPKSIIVSDTKLNTIATDGTFVFDPAHAKVWDNAATPSPNVIVQIEKQDKFVAYIDTKLENAITFSGVSEGDWVRITTPATPSIGTPIASLNTGIFRVVRIATPGLDGSSGQFWIENSNVLEETACECDLQFIKFNSVMPGDTLNISTDLWNLNNKGNWTITSVGDAGAGVFKNFYTFKVSVATKNPTVVSSSPGILSSSSSLVQVIEAVPTRLIKQVYSISPNQSDNTLSDIKFTTGSGYSFISRAGLSIISSLDKLNFPTSLISGIDGYKHNTGLIAEVAKVIYGDPSDSATYPGVASAGAKIDIDAPLIKRIVISLLLRTVGSNEVDIANEVRSAVAAVINATGVGEQIAFSDIVGAARRTQGVLSVTVLSPLYDQDHDLISVAPGEKLRILNLDNDILVSFL